MSARILLADDDNSVRTTLGRALESVGYEVFHARGGQEAVTGVRAVDPDLVILDLAMPDKNGWWAFDVTRQITPKTPIILITGWSNMHLDAQKRGADALMEKPLNVPDFLALLALLLAESPGERAQRLSGGGNSLLDSRNLKRSQQSL